MAVKPPSSAELLRIATALGFHFDAEDVEFFRGLLSGALKTYETLDRLPDALPDPRYPRLPGHIPAVEEIHSAHTRVRSTLPEPPVGPSLAAPLPSRIAFAWLASL